VGQRLATTLRHRGGQVRLRPLGSDPLESAGDNGLLTAAAVPLIASGVLRFCDRPNRGSIRRGRLTVMAVLDNASGASDASDHARGLHRGPGRALLGGGLNAAHDD